MLSLYCGTLFRLKLGNVDRYVRVMGLGDILHNNLHTTLLSSSHKRMAHVKILLDGESVGDMWLVCN